MSEMLSRYRWFCLLFLFIQNALKLFKLPWSRSNGLFRFNWKNWKSWNDKNTRENEEQDRNCVQIYSTIEGIQIVQSKLLTVVKRFSGNMFTSTIPYQVQNFWNRNFQWNFDNYNKNSAQKSLSKCPTIAKTVELEINMIKNCNMWTISVEFEITVKIKKK